MIRTKEDMIQFITEKEKESNLQRCAIRDSARFAFRTLLQEKIEKALEDQIRINSDYVLVGIPSKDFLALYTVFPGKPKKEVKYEEVTNALTEFQLQAPFFFSIVSKSVETPDEIFIEVSYNPLPLHPSVPLVPIEPCEKKSKATLFLQLKQTFTKFL